MNCCDQAPSSRVRNPGCAPRHDRSDRNGHRPNRQTSAGQTPPRTRGRLGRVHRVGARPSNAYRSRSEKSGGDDLKGQAEAVVVTAPIGQELAIGIVEVEVTCELRRSRLAGVAAVAPSLVVSEEFNGHRATRVGWDSTDKVT